MLWVLCFCRARAQIPRQWSQWRNSLSINRCLGAHPRCQQRQNCRNNISHWFGYRASSLHFAEHLKISTFMFLTKCCNSASQPLILSPTLSTDVWNVRLKVPAKPRTHEHTENNRVSKHISKQTERAQNTWFLESGYFEAMDLWIKRACDHLTHVFK